jgi:hypothetical protein
VWPTGKFSCAVYTGEHPEKRAHNKRIIELLPELGTPRKQGLLEVIKATYPATVAALSEASPVDCAEGLSESKNFLNLFPEGAILWCAPSVTCTGKPDAAIWWKTREQWLQDPPREPGSFICGSSFKPGTHSRAQKNVVEHVFVTIESDSFPEPGDTEEQAAKKLYQTKDEFCSLIRWLREGCGWHLVAAVDTGKRSLHGWFCHPGKDDLAVLKRYSKDLGLDGKFIEPSQPWRFPGVRRENGDKRQKLIYCEVGV